MKAGWDVKALGEVCDVLDSKRKPITKRDRIDGPYPYYGATGVLGHVDGYLFDEPLVLLGEDGAKWGAGDNSAFSVEGKVWVNNHAHVLRPNRTKLLDAWLIYFLNFSDLSEFISGMTVPKLNQGMMNSIPIPLPPLDEQKRIVEVLDAAFEGLSRARAHTETNLQNARELFLRSIECEFELMAETHERQTVGEIATIKGGKRLPKGEKTVTTETPFPYISIKDFNDQGSIDIAGIDYLLPATRDAIKNYIIRSDDLYISIAGTIGKTGIVPPELDGANLTENAARMVFKESINNEYVYFFTLTADFQDQAGLNTRTAAQPKLALERLKTISVPIVPLVEQVEMASKLRSMREQTQQAEYHYRAKLADLDALRQALLQKAFAGELT